MVIEEDCCATCRCGHRVCRGDDYPPSACNHGQAACEDCVGEVCPDCAEQLAREAEHDAA